MTNHTIDFSTPLRSRIMRRVYYAFVLSFILHPAFLKGALLGGGLALLGRLTHVASWSQNLLAVPLGQLPTYVWSVVATALANGEFLKLLSVGLIIYALLSFRLPRRELPRREWQAV